MNLPTLPGAPSADAVFHLTLKSFRDDGESSSGRPRQKIVVHDKDGEYNITLYCGNNSPFTKTDTDKVFAFQVWTQKGKYLSAYLQSNEPINEAAVSPAASQSGANNSSSNESQGEGADWDTINLRNARMNGLNNATAMLVSLAELMKDSSILDQNQIKGIAEDFVGYIYNGMKAGKQLEEHSAQDEGAPF